MKNLDDFKQCKLNYGVLIRTNFADIQKVQEFLSTEIGRDAIVFQDLSADPLLVVKKNESKNEGGGND